MSESERKLEYSGDTQMSGKSCLATEINNLITAVISVLKSAKATVDVPGSPITMSFSFIFLQRGLYILILAY